LRYNGGDAIVQDKEIDTIKSILESGYSLETINKPDDFEVGNQVTIKEGPLKGSVVDIIRRNSKEYFLVSFDTLGQSIKVELPFNVFEIYNK
jgi:transcription antitermination factor NusG